MKKRLLTAAFFVGAWGAYSQVGIGTLTPNKSAQLDIVSQNSGVLFPRIKLTSSTDATTITQGNVNSIFVYNTTTVNDVKPGYYYWYEDRWMRVVNDADVIALDKNTTNASLVVLNQDLVLTDTDGNTVSVPLSAINIPTTIIKNTDGTYTYTNEAGTTVIIDATDNVINNFENIVNNTDVLNELIEVLGDTYVGGNVYYDGTQFTYVDQAGDTHVINIKDIVQANETITTIVNNNDGTYTYTNEAGVTAIIDVPASVVNQFENIYNDIVNEQITVGGATYNSFEEYLTTIANDAINIGGSAFIDVTGTGTAADPYQVSIKEGAANSMLITNAAGNVEWASLSTIVKANETITTIVNNNDGTYTYTNEAGATAIIDVPASVVNQFENIYNDIVNEQITVDGATYNSFEEYLTTIANDAVNIGGSAFIDVTGTGTAADPYQVSIKEGAANSMLITNAAGNVEWASLSTIVKANETITTIVNNNDGTYTYTNEAGATAIIDVPASVVNQFENIYNDIVNEQITVGGATYNTFEEYLTTIANDAINIGGSAFIDVTGTGTAADPYQVSIKEGAANSMLITNAAGNVEWASLSSIVKANETLTVLSYNNATNELTYTDEKGTASVINLNEGSVSYDGA
ncbi:hypothetical protein SAMN05421741_11675, partial [Paenimyroides ummariense]